MKKYNTLLLIDTKVGYLLPTFKVNPDQSPLGSPIFMVQQFGDILVLSVDFEKDIKGNQLN